MFQAVKRAATVVIIALLVYLFIVPSAFLRRLTDRLTLEARSAQSALADGGSPREQLTRMREELSRKADTLKLFLDHDSVDAVLASVSALEPLVQPDELRSALAAVLAELEHLRGIEQFDLYTLF